jgi:hypothetical protein
MDKNTKGTTPEIVAEETVETANLNAVTDRVTLEDDDTLDIEILEGIHEYDVEEDSEMHGKTYRRFKFRNKVFISNDQIFIDAVINGTLKKVVMAFDGEYWSVESKRTWQQVVNQRKNRVTYDSISVKTMSKALLNNNVAEYEDLG